VSQNTPQGDGSRFASEPAPLSARGSQIPRLPATIQTSCRFGCAVGVVASSIKAAPIIRLWAASDVVALDLPLVGAWWCCYRSGGLAVAPAGWVLS
jgi:hypothetical protein